MDAAILIDKNGVLPKWFGYLNLCNALTEIVVSPAWIFDRGGAGLERRHRLVGEHGGVRHVHPAPSSSWVRKMIAEGPAPTVARSWWRPHDHRTRSTGHGA